MWRVAAAVCACVSLTLVCAPVHAAPVAVEAPLKERRALLDMYTSLGGGTWSPLRWDVVADPCKYPVGWAGVTCNAQGHVVSVSTWRGCRPQRGETPSYCQQCVFCVCRFW